MEQRKVSVEELDSVPLDHVWVVWLFVILSVIKWFITYLILLNTKRDKGYRSIYCHTTRQLLSPGLETPQFIMKTPLSKKCFLVFKALYKNDIKFTLYLIFGAWNIWTAQFRLKFDYEMILCTHLAFLHMTMILSFPSYICLYCPYNVHWL